MQDCIALPETPPCSTHLWHSYDKIYLLRNLLQLSPVILGAVSCSYCVITGNMSMPALGTFEFGINEILCWQLSFSFPFNWRLRDKRAFLFAPLSWASIVFFTDALTKQTESHTVKRAKVRRRPHQRGKQISEKLEKHEGDLWVFAATAVGYRSWWVLYLHHESHHVHEPRAAPRNPATQQAAKPSKRHSHKIHKYALLRAPFTAAL